MTKTRSTKRALLTSALALLMCVSMLIGSTFAWFTDSVTSSGNIIKSGTLDVEMYWAKGTEAPESANWTDASTGAIFNYDLWEPGYTEVRHIKIENKGSLALKYQLSIAANGEATDLAEVIDVYYLDPAQQLGNRAVIDADMRLGTLNEVLDAISTTASGNLEAGQSHTITLALKMQESAGNEYQNKSIGTDFSVKLSAIQLNFESDSFGDDYDEGLNPEAIYAFDPQSLKDAMLVRDGYIVLNEDIIVDETTSLQWGAYMFVANGREVTIDLNGHDIIVEDDALLKTNAVFTTANGGTLNIVGDGTVTVKNGKSGIFHAMNKNDQINVYSGTYISNSDNGSNALAIMYTNSGNIDVYGGKFIPLDGIECANAEDTQGSRLSIVFHEGAVLKHTKYYAGYDATRIQLDEGCTFEAVEIGGETWYQVVKGNGVSSASDLISALNTEGAYIVLQNDVALDQSVTVNKSVTLNLNNKTLTTMGLDFAADATIENGTIASGGNTNLVPHLKATAGTLTMDNVTVDVKHHLNANVNWSEASGMEVQNAKAVLNNCNVKINNDTKAKWVYSYGISLNNAEITVNGGSITAECVAGTAANGPTNPNAISTMGECTATLNDVNVTAMYYVTTVNGHATINTTDKSIASADFVDNRGGSHTLNYID